MIFTVTLNPAIDKELSVPEIETNVVLRASAIRKDWGGKGFNVSRMLAGLGAKSTALAFVGGDAGRQIVTGIEQLGIQTDVCWVEGETRTNVTIAAQQGETHIKVNEKGPNISSEAQAEMLAKIHSLAAANQWWVLAGSLPPGVKPDFYAQMTAILNEAGAQVVLDTSGEPLRLGCAAKPFLVKPNSAEAKWLTGAETPWEQAYKVQELGVENCFISLGKDGVLVLENNTIHQVKSPKIVERNPIGAGDALVAGFVWAKSSGKSWPESIRWGIACGAAAASTAGTTMGEFENIEALYQKVE